MEFDICKKLAIFITALLMFACGPEAKTPWFSNNGYNYYSGKVTEVKSGNQFRVRGLSGNIKVYGIKIPSDETRAEAAKLQLYNLLKGEEVVCLMVHQAQGSSSGIPSYCQVLDTGVQITPYMLKHKFADPDCDEIISAFPENAACRR